MTARSILLILLGLVSVTFIIVWVSIVRKSGFVKPKPVEIAIGFVTDFFDTLGIGSFAPTLSMFKLWRLVPDERIPGTLNAGHSLPTILEALVFVSIVAVSPVTLYLLIGSAISGAWLGAGVVAKWPRRYVQAGMGAALLVAATFFLLSNLNLFPAGGTALALEGPRLWLGVGINFLLGALMTLGIGLYAPCMIVVSLLGMNPTTAFPIMMGSCAFLMPIAGMRFMRLDACSLRATLGLTIGGLPGVLIAAFIVKSLPITAMRWLVVIVVVYAAVAMIRSAIAERARVVTAGA